VNDEQLGSDLDRARLGFGLLGTSAFGASLGYDSARAPLTIRQKVRAIALTAQPLVSGENM